MIKDGSTILLTEEDIEEYARGNVSDRLREVWGITSYDELKELLKKQNSKAINDGSKTTRTEEIGGSTAGEVQEQCSQTSGVDGNKT